MKTKLKKNAKHQPPVKAQFKEILTALAKIQTRQERMLEIIEPKPKTIGAFKKGDMRESSGPAPDRIEPPKHIQAGDKEFFGE